MAEEKKTHIHLSPKISEYAKILEKNPDSPIFINLADEYRKGKMFEEAVVILEEGLQRHPRSSRGFYLLGLVYYDSSQFDKARPQLEKALQINADNLRALKLLAKLYVSSQWFSDAKKLLHRAQKLAPHDREIGPLLAELEPEYQTINAGQQPAAAVPPAEPSPAPQKQPSKPAEAPPVSAASLTLAALYLKQGFIKKAVHVLDKILRADPMNIEARNLREQAINQYKQKYNVPKPANQTQEKAKRPGGLRGFIANMTKSKKH